MTTRIITLPLATSAKVPVESMATLYRVFNKLLVPDEASVLTAVLTAPALIQHTMNIKRTTSKAKPMYL